MTFLTEEEDQKRLQFTITTNSEQETFEAESVEDLARWMKVLRKLCFLTGYAARYEYISDLNSNTGKSQIRLVRSREDQRKYVAKVYSKNGSFHQSYLRETVRNEIKIMSSLEGDKFVRLFEFFNESDEFILIIEFARGGTLLSRILSVGSFGETQAAVIFRELVEGVNELHANNILHRDLKLENIFLPSRSKTNAVQIGDFDISSFISAIEDNQLCGTPGYVAPEIFKNRVYSRKSDVYSLGVILYSLVIGKFPFRLKEAKTYYNANKPCPLHFEDDRLEMLSPALQALIRSLLEFEPQKRPTAEDILKHTWLTTNAKLATIKTFDGCEVVDDDENYLEQKNINFTGFVKTGEVTKKATFTVKMPTPTVSRVQFDKESSVSRNASKVLRPISGKVDPSMLYQKAETRQDPNSYVGFNGSITQNQSSEQKPLQAVTSSAAKYENSTIL